MFDLEANIREWKALIDESRSMSQNAAFELEAHLRDSISELMDLGLCEREAFLLASLRLGAPGKLSQEFRKVNEHGVWKDRILWMTLGFVSGSALVTTFNGLAAISAATAAMIGLGGSAAGAASLSATVVCWSILLYFMWQAGRRDRGPSFHGVVSMRVVASLIALNVLGHGLRMVGSSVHARSAPIQEIGESVRWTAIGGLGINICVLMALVAMIAAFRRPGVDAEESIA